MIKIGKKQFLRVHSENESGFRLRCPQGEEVFMPGTLAHGQKGHEVQNVKPALGDRLEVFVYTDSQGELLATAKLPHAELGDFAVLEVVASTAHGAFLDLGLPKDLLVPPKLQRHRMEKGEIALVRIEFDAKTKRLYGNARVSPFVERSQIDLKEKQSAVMVPFASTPLGFKVLIDNRYVGLAFHNETHCEVIFGKSYLGTVKSVRPDGHIDVLLKATGALARAEDTEALRSKLRDLGGRVAYTPQIDPEAIKIQFGMSKKAFKQALGQLYKRREIKIGENFVELV